MKKILALIIILNLISCSYFNQKVEKEQLNEKLTPKKNTSNFKRTYKELNIKQENNNYYSDSIEFFLNQKE